MGEETRIFEVVEDPFFMGKRLIVGAARCCHCNAVFTYSYEGWPEQYSGWRMPLSDVIKECPECGKPTKGHYEYISIMEFKFTRWWRGVLKKIKRRDKGGNQGY